MSERIEEIRERLDRGYTLPAAGGGQYEGVSPASDIRYLLDRIEAQREVVEAARGFISSKDALSDPKNMWPDATPHPEPKAEYHRNERRLREALDNLEEQTDD